MCPAVPLKSVISAAPCPRVPAIRPLCPRPLLSPTPSGKLCVSQDCWLISPDPFLLFFWFRVRYLSTPLVSHNTQAIMWECWASWVEVRHHLQPAGSGGLAGMCSFAWGQLRSGLIRGKKVKELVAQLCPILCDPVDCYLPGSSIHGIFQTRIFGAGCHFLLQGIFPTQGSNPGLPHCRKTSRKNPGQFQQSSEYI